MTKKKTKSRPSSAKMAQNIPKIAGQGDYKVIVEKLDKMMKAIPKGTFSAMGSALAGPVGAVLGSGISSVTGYGDYSVSSNTLSKTSYSTLNEVPSFSLSNGVRVRHREYIGDLVTPSFPANFRNTTYRINPGSTTTFPWLNRVANQYQQYKIKGMVVYFKSTSSEYTAASALGSVIIASNYNVLDPAYTNAIEMQNSQYCVSSKPSCSMVHAIECDPSKCAYKQYYTQSDGAGISATNDFAILQIATQGLAATAGTVLGQIWIAYDIEFLKPIIPQISTGFKKWTFVGFNGSTGAPYGDETSLSGFVPSYQPLYSVNSNQSEVTVNRSNLTPATTTFFDVSFSVDRNRISLYRPGVYQFSSFQSGTFSAGNGYTITSPLNCTVGVANDTGTLSSAYSTWSVTASNASQLTPASFLIDWQDSCSGLVNAVGEFDVEYIPPA